MSKALLLYAPVLHEGYVKLYQRMASEGVETVFILSSNLIQKFTYLEPEIRALAPAEMQRVLVRSGYFKNAWQLDDGNSVADFDLIAVDDSMTRRVVERLGLTIERWEKVFLRWDESSVLTKTDVNPDRISTSPHDRELMDLATQEANLSSDWWRRVGAVLVGPAGEILYRTHNQHVPSEHAPYAEGDPRDFVQAGTQSDIATVLHCEQAVITWAASGMERSLARCDLVITTFPCPMCAKQLAYSGIAGLYFATGHASLDGERVLRHKGVELILVK